MKRCPQCSTENSDAMNFCLQCGAVLNSAQSAESSNPIWGLTDKTTESFGDNRPAFPSPNTAETATVPRGFQTPQSSPPPKNKSLFIIIGGISALLILLGIGAFGIIGYGIYRAKQVKSSPTPIFVSGNSPTPSVSFTPPISATATGSFKVAANQGWQISNINVVGNEKFITLVSGTVDLNGIKKSVSSNGVDDAKNRSRRLLAEYPTGALLMRTRSADGKTSNVQAVTAPPSLGIWQNFPDEFGKLEFCVNDNAPQRNSGEFTVTVTMTNAPNE